jgi:hypothetical protein
MESTALGELASIVRSKNAGICWLTLDVMFDDADTYKRVKDADVVTKEKVAELYKRDLEDVRGPFFVDGALAVKVSFLREVLAGDPEDTDVYGGQQHAPLLDLLIPDSPASVG